MKGLKGENNFMNDVIEKIGNSLIQHGKHNQRIYLMHYDVVDQDKIFIRFDELIKAHNYTKIFVKIPQYSESIFIDNGFTTEASIPNFFECNKCLFMGKFLSKKRSVLNGNKNSLIKAVLLLASKKKSIKNCLVNLPEKYKFKILSERHADQLSRLYKFVFKSYPFPIFDKKYLLKTMQKNVVYFGFFRDKKLVAASSSEVDLASNSVEMTDFATHPDFRGENLSFFLLERMEKRMKKENIKTSYTIARSLSYGMNITFNKSSYRFAGTLVNNTNIAGKIESMNVWYKSLV